MPVTITSTTDTPDAVLAAQGDGKAKEVVPVEETKPAPDTEKEPVEKADASGASDTDDVEDDGQEAESEGESDAPEKPKKKNGFKKRIDKLNRNLTAKAQEAEYWRAEAMKLSQKPAEPKPLEKADATKRPKADDFDKHEDYVEALTDWKVDQKTKEQERQRREQEVKSHHEKQMSDHRSRLKEFVKAHSDFEDVVSDVDDIRISPTVQQVILESDSGPALMYELAKNRDEYERINGLSPIAAARALGRIEAKVNSASSAETTQSAAKPKPKPKPIEPVGSNQSASTKSPDEMTYQEYKAWWAKTHKR
jgi:hypothetical protein